MTDLEEIGNAKTIMEKWLLHHSGNPMSEALMLKELSELTVENKPLTQNQIKDLTGFSQAQISKRLRLLSLIPELQDRVLNWEMCSSTAYQLSRLPPEKQKEFLGQEYITFVEASEAARQQAVSKELLDLVESPLPEPKKECIHKFVCIRCGKKLKE